MIHAALALARLVISPPVCHLTANGRPFGTYHLPRRTVLRAIWDGLRSLRVEVSCG